jgi:predicted XRE-type DNA-binding protein
LLIFNIRHNYYRLIAKVDYRAKLLLVKEFLTHQEYTELDREGLSVRAAHGRTGIAASDFSRIRNADLGRFTVDRLMSIINRLGSRIEVKVRVRRAETVAPEATA